VLRDRSSAPVGTGMIVVQAPTPNPTATASQIPEAQPSAAAGAVATKELVLEPAAPASVPEKKITTAKARKPTAAAPAAADPMQQMTTGVASAFAKQKAGVIDCLNKHPDQVESSPQLTVRVSIDKHGKVTEAELLPEAISSKSVGSCVRGAVSAMSFPTQEQPMTFRVPLMWRRK
jgi:hypothetical protein